MSEYGDTRHWRRDGRSEKHILPASLLLPGTPVAILSRNSYGDTRKLGDQLRVDKRYARERRLPIVYIMRDEEGELGYEGSAYGDAWEWHLLRESARALDAGADAVLAETVSRFWRSEHYKDDRLAQPQDSDWRRLRWLMRGLPLYAIHSAAEEHSAMTKRTGKHGHPRKPDRPEHYDVQDAEYRDRLLTVAEMHAQGRSLSEIGAAFGKERQHAQKWVNRCRKLGFLTPCAK